MAWAGRDAGGGGGPVAVAGRDEGGGGGPDAAATAPVFKGAVGCGGRGVSMWDVGR